MIGFAYSEPEGERDIDSVRVARHGNGRDFAFPLGGAVARLPLVNERELASRKASYWQHSRRSEAASGLSRASTAGCWVTLSELPAPVAKCQRLSRQRAPTSPA